MTVDKRTTHIHVRATPEDKTKLKRCAKKAGKSLSVYLLDLALANSESSTMSQPAPMEQSEQSKLIEHLFNQAAKLNEEVAYEQRHKRGAYQNLRDAQQEIKYLREQFLKKL